MTYFTDVLDHTQLKKTYRQLAMSNHPDKGGQMNVMQKINEEYSIMNKGFTTKPRSLDTIIPGHTVYVNKTACVVMEVNERLFKAISLRTKRQAYFDKTTGYGLFNFKIRATISEN